MPEIEFLTGLALFSSVVFSISYREREGGERGCRFFNSMFIKLMQSYSSGQVATMVFRENIASTSSQQVWEGRKIGRCLFVIMHQSL